MSSQTEGFRFVNLGGEPQEIYEVNNDIGMGLDFFKKIQAIYILQTMKQALKNMQILYETRKKQNILVLLFTTHI